MQILNPAGGLVYHWRAYKNSSSWGEFRGFIREWISKWPVPNDELILVGPSAGYCLPIDYLASFKRLLIIDTDPFAIFLLKRKIQSFNMACEIQWSTRDAFSYPPVLDKYSHRAPILFCNILGQLRLINFDRDWETVLRRLTKNRPWASFHDRISGASFPFIPQQEFSRRLEIEDLEKWYKAPGILVDHMVPRFDANTFSYATWPIAPGQFHLIEACQSYFS